ncbi:acetylornithine transaminase [Melghirimyces algeriensis]|uniref:Acetylornithine aminotransferase n=1 Tax=Melghirimyces algeriensis TaxID=910412 RepID=A0A521D304_9BACL|nr:acetylornithine transaminase [Melghirimyces algeriensis]SMO66085.1 acetylornithine aminotransferase [Melghirimyces algeriensis]
MALFPTYLRSDLHLVRGEGSWLWDDQGKRYLDFTSGLGVCNLGHTHPEVKSAVQKQLNHLWHVSNLFHIPQQEEVSALLAKETELKYAFFCNSGAESVEAAIKLARRYGSESKGLSQPEVVTFHSSFHGRTLATLTATGQEKVKQGFAPLPEGFRCLPYNDVEALESGLTEHTAAVLLEIIQGEGGICPAGSDFLKRLERLCRQRNILLMVDEVQTGIGRTGDLFAFQHAGIQPDVVTVAKGLGNGFPVGAMLGRSGLEKHFGPGSHASTFGGNPLAMAAAKAVLQEMTETDILIRAKQTAQYLQNQLEQRLSLHASVVDIRGQGLMWGVELNQPVAPLIRILQEKGLLAVMAGPKVLRLLPPLVTEVAEVEQAVSIIDESLHLLEEVVEDGGVFNL